MRAECGLLPSLPILEASGNQSKTTMKLTKKITLIASLIAGVTGLSFAQEIAAPTTSDTSLLGNLGKRYVETSVGLADVHNTSRNAYAVSASVNSPVNPFLDVGAGLGYGWFNGTTADSNAKTIGASATFYKAYGDLKPFVSVGLGYEWTKVEAGSFRNHSEGAIWAGAVGVEIPLTVITLTPSITYNDDFRNSRNSTQAFSYNLEASYWASSKLGFFVGTGYTDVRKSSTSDGWGFDLGARFRF